jgi:hypothetical protein
MTRWWWLMLVALVACRPRAPVSTAAAPPTVVAAPVGPAITLARVAVIGASVSAGFTAPRVADMLTRAGATVVADAADVWMFQHPDDNGAAQVATARAAQPTITIAVDFLFWFAYQRSDFATRSAAVARGLELLAGLDGAVALGDLADMSGADPRWLGPDAVPPPEQLAALNRQIHTWAAARPHTLVMPLSEWTQPLLAGGIVELGPDDHIAARDLMFFDGLHPNQLGLWYLLVKVDRALEDGFGVGVDQAVFARP